jgi:hypothetical protein
VLLLAAIEDGLQHANAVDEAVQDGSAGRCDLPTGTVYPSCTGSKRPG